MEFIDLKTPYRLRKEAIDAAIGRVLEHGGFIMGPEVAELERVLAEYVGVGHCVSTANGTVSLEIALRALGVEPGDEVVTVPFSWISSAEVISLVGARPVFVDIDPVSYTMDPARLAEVVGPRTKAVIAVSLFGQMPDVEAIEEIVGPLGIPVIEDAAQSFGASRRGRRSCGASRVGSTSFFPAKPLGCYGDGGALFTDDEEVAQAMRAIRTHGGVVRHHHTLVGTNGRFDTIQAAVLLAKFGVFGQEVEARGAIGARYSELLAGLAGEPEQGGIVTPVVAEGNTHVYGQYTVRVSAAAREAIMQALREQGIPTGIYYPRCFHEQPVFAGLGYGPGSFPASERASREVLSLPMHPYLEPEAQDRVVEALGNILASRDTSKLITRTCD